MNKLKIFIPILFIIIICGCSNEVKNESDLIGEWISSTTPDQSANTITQQLIFEPNGNFSTNINIITTTPEGKKDDDSVSASGKYSLSGDEVTLTYETLTGSVSAPQDISADELLGIYNTSDAKYSYKIEGNELTLIETGSQHEIQFVRGTVE